MNKYQKYIKYLAKWITDYVNKYHLNGVIVGVSGGIDSAVVAGIIDKHTNIEMDCVYINIGNSLLDDKCIKQLNKYLKTNIKALNLDKEFSMFKNSLKIKQSLTISNLKPRIRMMTLYAIASEKKYLVLGTSNADELYLGYFTKFGDGGCDLMPLAHLNKHQVYEIAKELKIPKIIIERAPSASLFANQTDESEMGITYKEIDAYLTGKKTSDKSKKIIEKLHTVNSHKLVMPVKPNKKI